MSEDLRAYDRAVARITQAVARIPTRVGTLAVNFSKDRFRQQNWLDNTPEAWEPRKPSRRARLTDRRHILVKSGRLLRSIRKVSVTSTRVVIGTDVPYAQAHNDGLRISTVANVRTYTKQASTRRRNGRRENVRAHTVRAHRRTINFTMPQRQFLGPSAVLTRQINNLMTTDINRAIQGR